MNTTNSTEEIIEALVEIHLAEQKDARVIHLFKESLHNLVRQAKAEQMLEMRLNVDKSIGTTTVQDAETLSKPIKTS